MYYIGLDSYSGVNLKHHLKESQLETAKVTKRTNTQMELPAPVQLCLTAAFGLSIAQPCSLCECNWKHATKGNIDFPK